MTVNARDVPVCKLPTRVSSSTLCGTGHGIPFGDEEVVTRRLLSIKGGGGLGENGSNILLSKAANFLRPLD
ncbi:hypothetical protein LshimejAT787_0506260 [Lyophyllum shimeji]|uniref:Uncharacterized protein n=1 Tax=Lyophyllum shimeji TaxID=47721 RepID=A0A9P3PNY9_LYOSH|nr:hypothetical protein LshimejAT787_0506260 [Lyophyllum shimeji]